MGAHPISKGQRHYYLTCIDQLARSMSHYSHTKRRSRNYCTRILRCFKHAYWHTASNNNRSRWAIWIFLVYWSQSHRLHKMIAYHPKLERFHRQMTWRATIDRNPAICTAKITSSLMRRFANLRHKVGLRWTIIAPTCRIYHAKLAINAADCAGSIRQLPQLISGLQPIARSNHDTCKLLCFQGPEHRLLSILSSRHCRDNHPRTMSVGKKNKGCGGHFQ